MGIGTRQVLASASGIREGFVQIGQNLERMSEKTSVVPTVGDAGM